MIGWNWFPRQFDLMARLLSNLLRLRFTSESQDAYQDGRKTHHPAQTVSRNRKLEVLGISHKTQFRAMTCGVKLRLSRTDSRDTHFRVRPIDLAQCVANLSHGRISANRVHDIRHGVGWGDVAVRPAPGFLR